MDSNEAPTAVTKTLHENVAPHSVEVSQNAKGEVSFSVKIYAADEHEAARRAAAVLQTLRDSVKPAAKAA